jgi:hypothetical protein
MVVIQPFYLAGIHNKRFKTFIAHDGVSIPKYVWNYWEFSSKLGFWRRYWKRHVAKTYTTLTRHWLKNGTLNDLSRR